MGYKKNVQPQDFLHLYCDDYVEPSETEAQLTQQDIDEMQAEIEAENARNGF